MENFLPDRQAHSQEMLQDLLDANTLGASIQLMFQAFL